MPVPSVYPKLRRVVITGIGLITPLGICSESTWSALLRPDSHPSPASLYHSPHSNPLVVMRIPTNPPLPSPAALLGRDIPLSSHYALLAAEQALSDARVVTPLPDATAPSAGTAIGVGIAPIPDLASAASCVSEGKPRRISPYLVPRVLLNTPAGLVSQVHNLQGPNSAPATACAAGAHAIAEGFHTIARGDASIMVVGGTDAAIEPVALAAFSRARALSTARQLDPASASRPFDASRDGFVMGEGASVMVLEDAEHAAARGVRQVYAEICSVGLSGDAWHPTAPPPDGSGARRAMQAALHRANVDPRNVDYVNAHATGTPLGDAVERRAIAQVLKDNTRALVSSTKGATGHLLGAAGSVEAAFTAFSIANGIAPPTLNLNKLDVEDKVEIPRWTAVERYVPQVSQEISIDVAISNSFGFGGTNVSILFKAPGKNMSRRCSLVGSK